LKISEVQKSTDIKVLYSHFDEGESIPRLNRKAQAPRKSIDPAAPGQSSRRYWVVFEISKIASMMASQVFSDEIRIERV